MVKKTNHVQEAVYIPLSEHVRKRRKFGSVEIFLFVAVLGISTLLFSHCLYGGEKKAASINSSKPLDAGQCTIDKSRRFDCYPQKGPTKSDCEARGCCFEILSEGERLEGVPICFFPENYNDGYQVTNKTSTSQGMDIKLERSTKSFLPNDIPQLVMTVTYETPTRLRIRITDGNPVNRRWEVPLGINRDKSGPGDNPLYSVKVAEVGQPFSFSVDRSGPNPVNILETGVGFIFADQFLQLSYFLPSQYIYGLGEHRNNLLLDTNWSKMTLWNHDEPPEEGNNLYGDHPFYLMVEESGNSHGVFLLNSNAIEVALQPAPAITWRALGGVIDLYMFLGPNPGDVIGQYTEVIGRTFLPAYWSLGFHVCRWGYKTANETLKVVDRIREYGIPQDTQWNDLDYMAAKRDFTTDVTGFGNQTSLVEELHNRGMHYIMIVDPGISNTAQPGTYPSYDLGVKLDVFIKNVSGQPLIGVVWPGTVTYPDFTHPNAQTYWTTIAGEFHKSVPFDGIWIDMNELSNFVSGSMSGCPKDSSLENPPYLPKMVGGSLTYRTICMTAQQYLSTQYNLHTMYGFLESKATIQALTSILGKRSIVISRSTFPGQGHYGGHWTGDNYSSYHDMLKSVSAILSMNMFGITMVGADICGFRGNTNEHLCTRWHQLGAFYTFSRNHNDHFQKSQDPGAFGAALAASTRKVYLIRYSLLPYLYTLIHKSHMMGDTVLRPLFFEYPKDVATYSIDRQFLWGPALLISPALDLAQYFVPAYFPSDTWYDYYTGEEVEGTGGIVNLYTPLDKINLHVRGGYILPWQDPALTTTESRKNKFGLLVALNSSSEAEGDLFWDDGETIDTNEKQLYNMFMFSADQNGVYSNPMFVGYKDEPMLLGNVTVFGLNQQPSSVTVNGQSTHYNYNTQYKVLYVTNMTVSLLNPVKISWNQS